MKTNLLNRKIGSLLFPASLLMHTLLFAQESKPAKLKIIKIIDGDTTIIEESGDVHSLYDIEKDLEQLKGKEVKVSINVKELVDEALSDAMSQNFVFTLDSGEKRQIKKICIGKSGKDSTADLEKRLEYAYEILAENEDRIIRQEQTIQRSKDSAVVLKKIKRVQGQPAKEEVIVITLSDGQHNKKTVKTFVEKTDEDSEGRRGEEGGDATLKLNSFRIYPNPGKGKFSLEVESESGDPATVRISDINGRQVYEEKLNGKKQVLEIDLSNYSKGIYMLNLVQGKKTASKKIIIE